MRKLLLFSGAVTLLLATAVLALINLDFTIGVEDKVYYPNETIDVEVSVVNRDSFTAKDTILMLYIEQRTFEFKLGDMKSYDMFTKTITLPEFPPSTHNIRGVLNYSGIFDERFTLETYGSFEVKFPEVERFPRNVNIMNFEVPEKIYGGKEYEVKVTISNDGDVRGDLIVELAFMDETVSEKTTLEPGKSRTVGITPEFSNTGVSIIEARVYAVVDGIRYLLAYKGKEVFVQEEKLAKLTVDKIGFVGKDRVRQNDEGELKVYLRNIGGYGASNVKGILTSSTSEISVIDGSVDYVFVSVGDSYSPEKDTFKIKVEDAKVQEHRLNLQVGYLDSEERVKTFEVPISVAEDSCSSNKECGYQLVCSSSQCVDVQCGYCEYASNHQCTPYECCEDSQCPELYTCDSKLHTCKPPQCLQDWHCDDDEVCSSGECEKAFTVLVVPLGLTDTDKMTSYSEKELSFFDSISPLKEKAGNNVRVHYINPEICSSYSSCSVNDVQACSEEISSCATKSGLLGIADKIVAVTDKHIGGPCGFTFIGHFWSVNRIGCQGTIAHEMGHQLDLYHVRCKGTEARACEGVNAADCEDSNYKTDVMSYCSPETHYGTHAYNHMKAKYFSSYILEDN